MLIARKILFFGFIIVYLIVCPALILYAFGYILNPGKEGGLKKTGIIYISTIPSGATVILGNRQYKYKTPASITGLMPGEYMVKLKLRNYREWVRMITVKAGKAATHENVLLIKEDLKPTPILSGQRIREIVPMPGTDKLLLKTGSKLKDHKVFDLIKEKTMPLISVITIGEDGKLPVRSYFVQPESETIVLVGGSLWEKKFWLVDTDNPANPVLDISKLFTDIPGAVNWLPNEENIIFAVYAGNIEKLDVKKMAKYPHFIDKTKGFGIFDRKIYFIDAKNNLMRSDFDKFSPELLLDETSPAAAFFDISKFYQIIALADDHLVFLGNKGDLLSPIPPYEILRESRVSDFAYDENKKNILFWNNDSIWTAETGMTSSKGNLTERVKLRKIFDKGQNIEQCFWVLNGNHVLFRDGDIVYLLRGIFSEKTPKPEELIRIRPGSKIFFSDKNGSLYFLDNEGNLNRAMIVPQENLLMNYRAW
jgi:hypothetical protein